MATVPIKIKPLDGADGYLRWKESMLLRLHSVDVAYVLSDEPPASSSPATAAAAAAKKWARDDAVCRGHILAALSDRIFPDYVCHGTGRAVWEAVARTYDLEWCLDWYEDRQLQSFRRDFRFDEGAPFLEQLAHAEALVATGERSDAGLAHMICNKLPLDMATLIRHGGGGMSMKNIWETARLREEMRMVAEDQKRRQVEAARAGQGVEVKAGHRHRHR